MAQNRLFLRRLNNIKDKMDSHMEALRITPDNADKYAPKGGERLLKEEKRAKKNKQRNNLDILSSHLTPNQSMIAAGL